MRFMVLGSAAAEGWPGMFCACECCKQARKRGGREIRRRTHYQLGDKIHIDFGPDAYSSQLAFGLDYAPWEHLLITHSHQDHWAPMELAWRRRGFSIIPEGSLLTIYGNENVETSLYATYSDLSIVAVVFERAAVGQPIELSDGVTALPLLAEHADQYEQALNYVLSVGDRNLLIGNDTGWYSEPTWEALAAIGLDVAVLDCTSGGVEYREHHMGVAAVAEMKQEMLRRGILHEGSRVIANHFSHNGHMLHDELCAYFEPHGIEVGYDGMNVEL